MSRSTMCNLLHRGAEELRPIYAAALALVPAAADVNADETSMRQQDLERRAFMWSFVTPELIVYRYAPNRSGSTPLEVLGDSQGRLVVDQFTGYNAVTKPGRRLRAGCLAHARRKLYEQRENSETTEALDLIGDIYRIEAEAKEAGIVGTEAHLKLRKQGLAAVCPALVLGPPASRNFRAALGDGASHPLSAEEFPASSVRFLRFATIAPDNNVAEASLRRIALGRGNYLFFGNEDAGHNFAVLYTLVASCEKHGVNAIAYLTDVLTRVQKHPASRVAELLPNRWKPPGSQLPKTQQHFRSEHRRAAPVSA